MGVSQVFRLLLEIFEVLYFSVLKVAQFLFSAVFFLMNPTSTFCTQSAISTNRSNIWSHNVLSISSSFLLFSASGACKNFPGELLH